MAKADRAPKKIAGLKLPKSIRRAPAIRSLLASKAGRKILNDALIAGAAMAAQRVMEAHEAAMKSKTPTGKMVVKFEKPTKAGKVEKIDAAAQFETIDDVEQVAEQLDEPILPVKTRKSARRRSKAMKSAPDAAPVDDVVPTAAEELIPEADDSETAIDEAVVDDLEELVDLDDKRPVRPGAAD
jgi:hypothetical protein